MGSLFFPQLSSGALAQYPVRKNRIARTVKNILPDATMILYSDPAAARMEWQLSYRNLSQGDLIALQNHFSACAGPVHAFTFIDPTENMLLSSIDPTGVSWQSSAVLAFTPGAADPMGGTSAFTVANTGQSSQEIAQTLAVPSAYQYCFSLYVSTVQPAAVSLTRRGSSVQETIDAPVSLGWSRVVSSGRLSDVGTELTVAISIGAGQQITIFGPQLEPQLAPSGYRATAQQAGVYSNAHFAEEQLLITAEAPDLFSTSFVIEAAVAA